MIVTLANDKYNSYIRRAEMTWQDFIDRAEYAPYRQKKGTDAIIAGECSWEDGVAVRNDTGEVMCERDGTPIPRAVKGTRKVINRCMVILDVENQCPEFLDILDKLVTDNDLACCVYTTFSATKDNPRYRVMIPLDKPVDPQIFTKLTDAFIYDLGEDNIDPCSDRPNQYMFLPVTPEFKDADGDWETGYYFYKVWDGNPLDTAKALKYIDDNINRYSQFKKKEIKTEEEKAERIKKKRDYTAGLEYLDSGYRDPRTINSIVGSWCQQYDVIDVLEQFLDDIYTKKGTKYKWNNSPNDAGGIIKDDGQYFCNMHMDAPSSGINNSYDLVRLEMFLKTSERDATPAEIERANKEMYKFAYITLYGEERYRRKYGK